ncbi:MAG: hypothetical protein JW787_15285 [Sedimentisphaerales bacterium]|nr:hypothetical protein [Sedimentisphaerales bacterium]
MRTRDLIIVVVCIVLAAGLLIAAGLQIEPINRQRQEMKLIMDKPENLPPSLVFTAAATGAFKGLLVDFLWIRAERLKEEGQFFDARQLAEWITILQPRFASVWEFQAWNMAYNISVAIPETQPEQRWRWVKNGYELLRDEAIDKYKLRDIGLYHELGRIFQHKIGGISDEAHKYYKLQLATQMEPLLGSRDFQPELTDENNKYFDLLAESPQSWQEIIEDPNIVEFITALKSADERFSDESVFAENYLSLREYSGRYNQEAGQVIDKYRGTDTLRKFDIFAKVYKLRNAWKLDPVLMRKVNQKYGPVDFDDPNTHLPMDWRHADTQAIYWAEKGLEIAIQDSSRDISSAENNADRIVVHGLQNLFRLGNLITITVERQVATDDPSKPVQTVKMKEIFLRPDLRYFKPYNDAILKVVKKYDNDEDRGTYETLRNGHRNMLKNAVLLFFQSGHREQAQKIYNYMKKEYPLPEFDISLVEFAQKRMLEELQGYGYQDATDQITAILREGYYYLAIGDDDAAAGSENNAKLLYEHYKKLSEEEDRIALPSFDTLKLTSMQDFVMDKQFPEYIRLNLFLGRLERDNRETYDLLIAELKKKSEIEK